MTTVVTPSDKSITKGQISKFYDILANALSKSGLPSQPAQDVLETQGAALADEFVALVRKHIEALTGLIVRRVKVNRICSPLDALKAIGRKLYVTDAIVDEMPVGTGDEADMVYFKPGPEAYKNGIMSCEELNRQYELRGLKPDPRAQAADNAADPAFADQRPNACQWKDAQGNWRYAAFDRWYDECGVDVDRDGYDWNVNWSFGGVRK